MTGQMTATSRKGLHQWFQSPTGRVLLELEEDIIASRLPSLFGYHLLQVGQLSAKDMLSGSLILQRHIIDIDDSQIDCAHPRIRSRADCLPVASDSIDVVMLPHVLEFETHPHEALREVQRVLVAEGNLLITGFNPWSMMGLWRTVLKGRNTMPWRGQFLGLNRVRDWLALLGFDVTAIDTFFFRPPLQNSKLMAKLNGMESFGPRLGGVLAGAYVIAAKKRISTLTPIKPRWSSGRRLASVGLANTSVRAGSSGHRRVPPHLTVVHAADHVGRKKV